MKRKRRRFCSSALVIYFGLISACGYTNNNTSSPTVPPAGGGGATSPLGATFTQVSEQVLQPQCVSCHGSSGQRPDLTSYAGFATNSQYVVPGNPSQSRIFQITQSGQMPPNGPHLTDSQLSLLSSWIQSGALNN